MTPTQATTAHPLSSRLGLEVRVGEGRVFSLLFGISFLLLAFQYTAKSVRQSAFIDALGAERLPWAYLVVAVASYPILLLFGRLAARHDLARVLAATSGVVALSLLLFAGAFRAAPASFWPSLLFYLWTAVVGVLLVSQFWSYAAARLDPRQARRLFAPIGAGGILGSIAGGQVARWGTLGDDRFGGWGPYGSFFLGAAILLVLGAVMVAARPVGTNPSALRATSSKPSGGFRAGHLIHQSRYLQLISAIMLLSALVAQVIDLQFAWVLEQRTEGLAERTAAYGNLYSLMGVAALIFQMVLTTRIHRRLGIGFALKVLPASNGLGSIAFLVAAAVAPALLWPVVWMLKVSENGLRYSLEQVTRELLFIPVPEHSRARAKAFVDVVVQRAAKGLAAVVLLTVTVGWLTVPQTAWIALVAVAGWLMVLGATRDRYIGSFREGLLRRVQSGPQVGDLDLRDGANLEVLIRGLGSTETREVCHSLDLLSCHGKGDLVPPVLVAHPDSQVRLRTLEVLRQVADARAAPWVEGLLGDPEPPVRAAAFRTLAALVPETLMQEMEERLYDPDPRVRSVAVAYLAVHADPGPKERADSSLQEMVADSDPEVRQEAARALGELDDPYFQAAIVQLLYDANTKVVRAAIGAVERRICRGEASPLYVPILISHLHRRSLKHDARATLVSYGERIIPTLQHFLFDINEQIWVRRALPRTIAHIGGAGARLALTDALGARDPFQRRKVIQALQDLEPEPDESRVETAVIENVIAAESRECLRLLFDLWSLESLTQPADDSPLLVRLLNDRWRRHRANVSGLLSLLHSSREMSAAFRGLASNRAELRSHSLEYLDNVLQGEVRQQVFAVIDELPRGDRLKEARRLFGLVPESGEKVLTRLALERPPGDYDAPWLTAAALQMICDAGLKRLYPTLLQAAERDMEPLVQETASLLIGQLQAGGHLPRAASGRS